MSEKDVIAMKKRAKTTETVHRVDGSVAENLLDVSGGHGPKALDYKDAVACR